MDDDQRRSSDRLLGEHSARIDVLQDDMAQIKADVRRILNTLSEARGGWKATMIVAGIAGTMGAVVAKAAAFVGWVPK